MCTYCVGCEFTPIYHTFSKLMYVGIGNFPFVPKQSHITIRQYTVNVDGDISLSLSVSPTLFDAYERVLLSIVCLR